MKVCTKCKEVKDFFYFPKDKKQSSGYRPDCKDCQKKYRDSVKEKRIEYDRLYYIVNKEIKNNYKKKYYKENKTKIIKKITEYQDKKCKNDSIFAFGRKVRNMVRSSFNRKQNRYKKPQRTELILGCSIEEFKNYIESKFTKGMTLENHGEWHLDHIIPIASAKSEEEILILNHYTNFQPLWAKDNLSKSSKVLEKQLTLI
jgi:hypothetical protein